MRQLPLPLCADRLSLLSCAAEGGRIVDMLLPAAHLASPARVELQSLSSPHISFLN